MTHLTGRYHHRTQRRLFGKPLLILQVEEYGDKYYMDDGKCVKYKGYTWRDATSEDMENTVVKWECVTEKPVDKGPPRKYKDIPLVPPL